MRALWGLAVITLLLIVTVFLLSEAAPFEAVAWHVNGGTVTQAEKGNEGPVLELNEANTANVSCAEGAVRATLKRTELAASLPGTPDGLAVSQAGELYAAAANTVVHVDRHTGEVDTIARSDVVQHLTGLAVHPTQPTGWVVDEARGELLRFSIPSPIPALSPTLAPTPMHQPAQKTLPLESILSELNNDNLRWANDVAFVDGTVVFTTSSRTRSLDTFLEELLAHDSSGQLIALTTRDGAVTEVHKTLAMANGVVAVNRNTVWVVETSEYQIREINLETGHERVVLSNLPGFPGNIRASDQPGVFWLTLLSPRNPLIDSLAQWPRLRTLLYWLPDSMRPKPTPYPCVLRISSQDGGSGKEQIAVESFWVLGGETDEGTAVSLSTALEIEGALYLTPAAISGGQDGRIFKVTL